MLTVFTKKKCRFLHFKNEEDKLEKWQSSYKKIIENKGWKLINFASRKIRNEGKEDVKLNSNGQELGVD